MTDHEHKEAIRLALKTLCECLTKARRENNVEFQWRLNSNCLEGGWGPFWRLEELQGTRSSII